MFVRAAQRTESSEDFLNSDVLSEPSLRKDAAPSLTMRYVCTIETRSHLTSRNDE